MAGLAFTGSANAAFQLNGSFGTFNLGGGAYSSTSLTLVANNYVNTSIAGDFVSILPAFSLVTADSVQINGIGSTPTSFPIPNFFQIASSDSLGGAGTTPTPNQFDFDLASLEYLGLGDFYGAGTLIDTTGDYAPSPAYFTVAFSGTGTYSFYFTSASDLAIPEASAYGICAGALALIPLMAGLLRTGRRHTLTA